MTLGTPEIQTLILREIQQLKLQGSFEMPKAWTAGMDRSDVDALYLVLEGLKADSYILGAVGSWGDTLNPGEVLERLQEWNESESKLRQ
jgi:hypothetical protein